MQKLSKFFIVPALMCVSAAAAYSQDCNSLLQRATELVSQKKYCDARRYYQEYGRCNADADVSTEVAMCERYCKIQASQGEDNYAGGTDSYTPRTSYASSGSNRSVESRSNIQCFSGFQLHGGLFMPLGKFAGNDDNKYPENGEGHATIGYNLGFKVYIPVSSSDGLSCLLGVDAFYNSMQKTYYWEDRVKEYEAFDDAYVDYTLPSYLNVPITGGVNYSYAINDDFSIYGEVTGSWNISKYFGGGFSYSIEGEDVSYRENWDIATGFTYGLEAGVLLKRRYMIGVKYNNLDSYRYKGKLKYVDEIDNINHQEVIKFDKSLPIGGVSFTVGVLF